MKNKAVTYFFLGCFFGLIITYSVFSFVFWDFNMWNWPNEGLRACTFFIVFFVWLSRDIAKNVDKEVKIAEKTEEDIWRVNKYYIARCPYNDGHFPCNHCKADSPKASNAACKVKGWE